MNGWFSVMEGFISASLTVWVGAVTAAGFLPVFKSADVPCSMAQSESEALAQSAAFFADVERAETGLPSLCRERPYEIVKTVTLAMIDYENFITDMGADRQFIENAAELCAEGEVMKCLLVRHRGKNGGVLVVPEYRSFVKWAAKIADLE